MIIIPSILESYRSLKDKTLKLVFETNEPSPDQFLSIGNSLQQFGYLAFKIEPFNSSEIEAVEALKSDFDDNGKTPSQRLRAVLYRNFEQNNEGYEDFQLYYNFKMEKLIKHLKRNLP